mmetsp:Transcript_32098/g.58045  ORF Transcript_32098/g.58045 Transcript_32098/m.58045 type:complete len:310 (-) Transcript_32098:98-1027(-)
MVCVGLPSPQQVWSHGTNSFAQFSEAIQDESITAIEADIVLGRDTSARYCDTVVPIMAHPPSTESDLSAATFLDEATKSKKAKRRLTKHLKLDFKEFDAVEPTLEVFKNLKVDNNGKIVYLNADVLEGPGKSSVDINVPADAFVNKCLELMTSDDDSSSASYAFSLGFKVEVHSPWGHTDDHLREMASVVIRNNLIGRSRGVVLAINARLLYKNTQPFEHFLLEFPEIQILVWTGSTEPPISGRKVAFIRNRFATGGHCDRVGFDCKIAETYLHGLMWDVLVDVYGMYSFLCKILAVAFSLASYKPKDS